MSLSQPMSIIAVSSVSAAAAVLATVYWRRRLQVTKEEVLASQAQAFRQCKELLQDRAERAGRALSKTLSRLPVQPAPAGTLPPAVAPELAGAQWWHEGPHVHNLFKWRSVQIQAGGGQ